MAIFLFKNINKLFVCTLNSHDYILQNQKEISLTIIDPNRNYIHDFWPWLTFSHFNWREKSACLINYPLKKIQVLFGYSIKEKMSDGEPEKIETEQEKENENENNNEKDNENDNENENEKNYSEEDEGSNAEDESHSNSNNTSESSQSQSLPKSPKRAPSKTFKSHASHSAKGAITFESQMSIEQIELNLIKIFGNQFPEASVNELALSDRLSVRDLRIIVRVLKLCDPSQVNVRKPLLCDYLMKHMREDHMTEVYEKYQEEKEKARLARMKSKEEKTKTRAQTRSESQASSLSVSHSSSSSQQQISQPSEPQHERNMPNSESNNALAKSTVTREKSKPEMISPSLVKNRATCEVTIPRLKYDSTFNVKSALATLESCNKFVITVSQRLEELERALSIMSIKVSELEKFYGCV
ncbi:hypothetical protein TRFO_06742 [Tritrichomonas foetus]|uniref:Uncharacterized protein n=1 Tax=Tritrichomonas foetus TaxID=1144522 RepID=A0A1J4JXB4_9EUKA|nr:hypothetical protein TRFO_06742 [Tritrichomonas foetus]|eukprot:OHT03104.1 hypothetical protein TRFO_06742 [Tritrichomonas foetus]